MSRLNLFLSFFLLSGVCSAADTVVVDQLPDRKAIRLVERLTSTANPGLQVHTLTELASAGGLWVSGGQALPCSAPPVDGATLSTDLKKARGHINYGRYLQAKQILQQLENDLACGEISPQLLSDVLFLQGILAAVEKKTQTAKTYFSRSLFSNHQLHWDGSFAPALGQELFQQSKRASRSAEGAHVRLGTQAIEVQFQFDGMPVDANGTTLAVGRHFLKIHGTHSWQGWLDVQSTEPVVLWPLESLNSGIFDALSGPEIENDLAPFLRAQVAEPGQLFITDGQRLWLEKENRFVEVTKTPSTEGTHRIQTSRNGPKLTQWIGSALFAGGAAWAIKSYSSGRGLYLDCWDGTTHDRAQCHQNKEAYTQARTQLNLAYGLAGLGGAVGISGWFWDQKISLRAEARPHRNRTLYTGIRLELTEW
jgi:hypothetical protein